MNKLDLMKRLSMMYVLLILGLSTVIAMLISVKYTSFYIPALSLENYTKVEPTVQMKEDASLLVLSNDCKRVTMVISNHQAESIILGIKKKIGYRPTTHDIISTVFKDFGIDVMMVKITELKNDTYFAKMFLRRGNKIVEVDIRPSDAVAIATRLDAPIYVSNSLLKDTC